MDPSSFADLEAVLRADAQAGYQLASLVAVPAYVASMVFRKRGLTLNRSLRATWLAGAGGAGAGLGYGWYESTKGGNYLKDRHISLAYDTRRVRYDDHSTIGAVLFGILTPALFWGKARALHLILGGAGVGSSICVATCAYRELSNPQPPTHGPVVLPSSTPPTDHSGSLGHGEDSVQ